MLLTGLWIVGTGEGLLILSGLGNSPWTVLTEGLGEVSGLSVGMRRSGSSARVPVRVWRAAESWRIACC